MRKKVLYVITKADVGGAKKYVNDLALNLDKEKFESRIIYGGQDIRWLSNKVYPHFFFLNDWLAVFELVKTLRHERPDVIHLNSSKAGILGSLAAWLYKISLKLNPIPHTPNPISHTLNPKIIFTAHGWVFNPTNYIGAPRRWFYIALHRIAALFQNTIINVSEYDRRLALKYKIAPAHKLITIHNGIDPNMPFLEKQTARKEILQKLEIGNWKLEITRPWVGSIGRLTPEKNYETLIEAATLVPNAYFFIIGSGPEEKKLQLLITNYSRRPPIGGAGIPTSLSNKDTGASEQLQNRFFIVPPTGNDAKYLKAFDVFTLTSIKEGLPYTLLEAMAAGLPVIVTDAGGMPEVVVTKSRHSIVPLKNPQALAINILNLFNQKNKARQYAQAVFETVKRKFNLEKMIKATEQVYLESSQHLS